MPRSKTNTGEGYFAPFAERLRELLEETKTPQTALADHIGVTRQAVSAYSLGTSLPDIDKFVGIADFFGVSTEYLLRRTEIKKADATKQAVAEYLGLSEKAIDAIRRLHLGYIDLSPERDYKPMFMNYPLPEVFSDWLESVDLSELIRDLYMLIMTTAEYNTSGLRPEKYKMNDEQKMAAFQLLQDGNYIVLSLRDQSEYYSQLLRTEFDKSLSEIMSQFSKIEALFME